MCTELLGQVDFPCCLLLGKLPCFPLKLLKLLACFQVCTERVKYAPSILLFFDWAIFDTAHLFVIFLAFDFLRYSTPNGRIWIWGTSSISLAPNSNETCIWRFGDNSVSKLRQSIVRVHLRFRFASNRWNLNYCCNQRGFTYAFNHLSVQAVSPHDTGVGIYAYPFSHVHNRLPSPSAAAMATATTHLNRRCAHVCVSGTDYSYVYTI